MVDWTPETIEAAHRAMFQDPYDGTTAAMIGAGLDAAAAAQGIKDEEITRLREENARLLGLLREAHVKMDANNLWSNLRNRVAAAIREGGKDEN